MHYDPEFYALWSRNNGVWLGYQLFELPILEDRRIWERLLTGLKTYRIGTFYGMFDIHFKPISTEVGEAKEDNSWQITWTHTEISNWIEVMNNSYR